MNKAVFLDRDGVITKLVLNPKTNEYESANSQEELEIYPGVGLALKKLQERGYLLFIVSNQPSYAKGKVSLEDIKKVHGRFDRIMRDNGIKFTEYYYCYHHPQGVIKEYSVKCGCRKPGTLFVEEAKKKYNVDMASSWFVGDRDTDIMCGQNAGLKTVVIKEEHSADKRGRSTPDHEAKDLNEAAGIILSDIQKGN